MSFLSMLLGILLAQTTQGAGSQNPPVPAPYVDHVRKEFSFYPGGKLDIVATVPGNIRVIGWQRASVLLEAEKVVFRLAPEQAKQVSDQYPVSVRWTQTLATIRTSGPTDPSAMEVNVTLYVPKLKTDVNVKMLQGDFGIDTLNGWVEASLGEGSIEAKTLSGYFSAVTQKGNVIIELSGKRWDGHSLTAVTRQGNIELTLPEDYSAAVQLETRDGELAIQYPEQLVEGESVPLQAASKKSGHFLKATIGSGGSPINLQTFAGNVRLTSK